MLEDSSEKASSKEDLLEAPLYSKLSKIIIGLESERICIGEVAFKLFGVSAPTYGEGSPLMELHPELAVCGEENEDSSIVEQQRTKTQKKQKQHQPFSVYFSQMRRVPNASDPLHNR
ncbi:hypothetical protein KIW84_060379 [Lathyrus oleraceus]|uniref:Uncharacterized protein n=1 Tax=Pisum sativum TaxID=3888 RepID=A0A9D5A2R1_PEA|nr:hypothetical protein KIW84_060379 [Pisum sativum]